ncbi:MAG: ParB/RepB/Spo0J family partition protein [Magnetococcales bacterium]|nr:ParB/RepB/Spo0J family partition protein [Magnetococcales bacterium]
MTKNYQDIPLTNIQADPTQPRKHFDQSSIDELAASIKQHGILQPVLVRKGSDDQTIIVAGERRFRAAKKAGSTKIPTIYTDGIPAELSLVENLLRTDLTPIETAEAMQRMIDDHGYDQKQLSKLTGKAKSTISEILSLTKLNKPIKEKCRDNHDVPSRVLVKIARIAEPKDRTQALKDYEADKWVKGDKRTHKGWADRRGEVAVKKLTDLRAGFKKWNPSKWKPEEREQARSEIAELRNALAELEKKLAE